MKNKKRYLLITLMVFIILLGSGCGKEPKEEMSIEEIVAKHYEQDFNYTKTSISQDENGEIQSKEVYVCEYEHDPYYEHVARDYDNSIQQERIAGPNETIVGINWTERTMSGDGRIIEVEFVTESGTEVQQMSRQYYIGYGEDITYTFVEEMELDGAAVSLYHAEYTEDIGAMYGFSDDIIAVITQEYYIDHTENQIVKIVTYLEDQTHKRTLAHYMAMNEVSYEEAKDHYLECVVGGKLNSIHEEILFYDYR